MGDTSSTDAWRRHIARLDANAPPAQPATEQPSLHDIWQAHVASYDAAEAAKAQAETAHTPPTDAAGRTQRHDGWTPNRQRTFLEAVAEGLSTETACRIADMSPSSAYGFKKRAAGRAFALGWRAAQLLGRERIADTLLDRAVNGFTETVTRANGDVIERHRYDNRMATAMLARLDRQADAVDPASIAANAAARAAAADFDQYLVLLDTPAPAARVERFLTARAAATCAFAPDGDVEATALATAASALVRADRFVRRGAALPDDVDAADLDPADRAGWTLDQWQRADAAGLVTPRPPAPEEDDEASPLSPLVAEDEDEGEDEDDMPVWYDSDIRQWRTSFPPPPGFDGVEKGRYGTRDYARALTNEEQATVAAENAAQETLDRGDAAARRDEWFARCAHDVVALHRELADRVADADGEEAGPSTDRAFFTAPDPLAADAATADSQSGDERAI